VRTRYAILFLTPSYRFYSNEEFPKFSRDGAPRLRFKDRGRVPEGRGEGGEGKKKGRKGKKERGLPPIPL